MIPDLECIAFGGIGLKPGIPGGAFNCGPPGILDIIGGGN